MAGNGTGEVPSGAEGVQTPSGEESPSNQTKKTRRGSQPADPTSTNGIAPGKKRKKSTGGSRSKSSLSRRGTPDPTATVEAAAMVLRQKVLEVIEQEPASPADDDWISEDKVLTPPEAGAAPLSSGSRKSLPARVRGSSRSTDSTPAPSSSTAPVSPSPTPHAVATPPVVEMPVRSPNLMNQYDETQIDNFLAMKPPVREAPCGHILDSKSDSGTTSSLAEKEIKNLTVQQVRSTRRSFLPLSSFIFFPLRSFIFCSGTILNGGPIGAER